MHKNHPFQYMLLLQLLLLAIAPALLYGNFLSNPLVFDDLPFFQATLHELQQAFFSLDLRHFPYTSFRWTDKLPGEDLLWWRLGNLTLHIANTCLLFLLLRKLFTAVLAGENINPPPLDILSPAWLAFSGAMIFALHPVAVYGVAYLVQRTSLMAMLFALLTWWLFLTGVLRNKHRWLLASAATYLLAGLSKEHSIMAPAVCAALLLLLQKPDRQLLNRVWPVFMLYGLIAAFITYQVKGSNILGNVYEINGSALLARSGIDPAAAYPLSILTQSFQYFKYIWLWLIPNPAWMSVDMPEDFASSLWSWPESAALVAFIVYPAIALRLLLIRGRTGLLGFALLCPWMMFATELSAVKIQEVFVLYRSYLWMPFLFAALPFAFQKLQAKYTVAILIGITLAIIPASWNRLTTFSSPDLLWGDALSYVKRINKLGTPRIYRNLGAAYRERGQYIFALENYNMVIRLYPNARNAFLDRAKLYEDLGDPVAALQDYVRSCQMGDEEGCAKSSQ